MVDTCGIPTIAFQKVQNWAFAFGKTIKIYDSLLLALQFLRKRFSRPSIVLTEQTNIDRHMTVNPVSDAHFSQETWPVSQSLSSAAWYDLLTGAAKNWLWTTLAIQDIKLRYRGSVLGPFWLTISTVVMVASMGVIYSTLFNASPRTYLPYFAIGLILWGYISGAISEGCQTFLGAEGIIQTVPLPYSVHAVSRCAS